MPIGATCGTSPAILHFRERSGALNCPPRRAWASSPCPHQPTQGQGGATEWAFTWRGLSQPAALCELVSTNVKPERGDRQGECPLPTFAWGIEGPKRTVIRNRQDSMPWF